VVGANGDDEGRIVRDVILRGMEMMALFSVRGLCMVIVS